jgi:hypothetical protein
MGVVEHVSFGSLWNCLTQSVHVVRIVNASTKSHPQVRDAHAICDSIEAPDKARKSIFTQSIVDSFLDATWPTQYKDVQLDTAPWWMTPKPMFGLFVWELPSTPTFLDQSRSRSSSSPMSVVPWMNASSAQVLRTIAIANANSLLCDIGGCQIPCDKESSVRCVNPHNVLVGHGYLHWVLQYLCIPRLAHPRGRGRYCWYLKSNPWCTATKPGRLRWSHRR